MRITPVATGASNGQSVGQASVTSGHTSAERIASAKSVGAGNGPMRMSQSETPIDERLSHRQQSIRSMTMKTDFSPDRFNLVPEASTDPQLQNSSAISALNEEVAIEDTKPLSPQFAALAKQRRALQVKERELADRERAMQGRASTGDGSDLAAQLKSQPLRTMQEQGILTPEFYNSLTEYLVSGQSGINPEVQALKEKIESLEQGINKNFEQRDNQAEESALTEMLYEAEDLAKDGDTYEMIRSKDAYDRVLRHIHKTYKETGRIVPTHEAMNLIETQLLSEAEAWYNIPKVQNRFVPQMPQQMQPQSQFRPPTLMKTLTNRDTAQPAIDRRTRMLLAATGQLRR